MNEAERLTVFRAQTVNVRKLDRAWAQIRRSINWALRRRDTTACEANTLVLALLYCAWLEALFSKILHTPYGLSLDEIEQISGVQSQRGIHEAWLTCIDIGLRRIGGRRSSEVPNLKLRLERLVRGYVQDPAGLRNKVAHGQWAVALNRDRTAVNNAITAQIASLDVVEIDRWRVVALRLCEVVEALIESPERHFRTTYWVQLTELEAKVEEMSTWTITTRIQQLQRKPLVVPST